jgi:hypothetical protein
MHEHEHSDSATPPPLLAIRSVDIDSCVEWIVGGVRLFGRRLIWMAGAGLALVAISWMLGWFGWIGPLRLSSALVSVFTLVGAGVLTRAMHALDHGQDPLANARAGARSAPLWMLGLIGGAMSIGLSMATSLAGAGSLSSIMLDPLSLHALGALIVLVLSIVLGMALWLAPALVVLKGLAPAQAIRVSLTAARRNGLTYLCFALMAMIALALGTVSLGLGLIFVYPVLIRAAQLACEQIVTTPAPPGAKETTYA